MKPNESLWKAVLFLALAGWLYLGGIAGADSGYRPWLIAGQGLTPSGCVKACIPGGPGIAGVLPDTEPSATESLFAMIDALKANEGLVPRTPEELWLIQAEPWLREIYSHPGLPSAVAPTCGRFTRQRNFALRCYGPTGNQQLPTGFNDCVWPLLGLVFPAESLQGACTLCDGEGMMRAWQELNTACVAGAYGPGHDCQPTNEEVLLYSYQSCAASGGGSPGSSPGCPAGAQWKTGPHPDGCLRFAGDYACCHRSGRNCTRGCIEVADPPVARMTVSPAVAEIGETITFDAAGSTGDIASYFWAFGDGGTGSGKVVSHSYGVPAQYVAGLTVTGPRGSSMVETTVVVAAQPKEPEPGPEEIVVLYTTDGVTTTWICQPAGDGQ